MNHSRTRRIYLTGFMGSGKSTLAPILANTLGYSFLDIDREIETAIGTTVATIFHDAGEQYFRQIEHRTLETLSVRNDCVFALGGGTIANQQNFELVKATGILIYLKSTVDEIIRRLRHKTDRPLLAAIRRQAKTNEEIRTTVASLLLQRERFYNQADIIISTTNRSVGKTIDHIIHALHTMQNTL